MTETTWQWERRQKTRRREIARRTVPGTSPRPVPGTRMPLEAAGSPLPAWWRDTAYAPANGPAGWADMRTYVKAPAMRTHRAAVVMPADPDRITARP